MCYFALVSIYVSFALHTCTFSEMLLDSLWNLFGPHHIQMQFESQKWQSSTRYLDSTSASFLSNFSSFGSPKRLDQVIHAHMLKILTENLSILSAQILQQCRLVGNEKVLDSLEFLPNDVEGNANNV